LRWIEEKVWESKYLNDLQQQCQSSEYITPAFKQIEGLAKLIKRLDYRLNILIGIILNLGFLWDIRCAYKIRKWHETSSEAVVKSFQTIGEFEALISLSTLHYNQPEWTFPEIKDGFVLSAKKVGHPLIHDQKRIYNNYSFEAGKTVDIITGSNMSGKSTFLRTIGVNMVLAYAGAPVCCKSMKLSPIKLISYMRIKDSLNESTSTFKAELDRLKMILEVTCSTPNSFALIDEMLRGTNSQDKYLGTKAFIEKLIEQNSAVIIATHDLQVAELEQQFQGQIRNYNFDIQTDGKEMYFDYQIKNGKCTTFNASILLKQIGLNLAPAESYS
jgi:DNA mismatch repair ATPase MutS